MRGVFCDGSAIQSPPRPRPSPNHCPAEIEDSGQGGRDLRHRPSTGPKGYMGFRGILGHEFVGITNSTAGG